MANPAAPIAKAAGCKAEGGRFDSMTFIKA